MEAYSCTNYTEVNNKFDENNEKFNLDMLLDVNHPDDFRYLKFEPTMKIPAYSFFFCAGDLKSFEFKNDK